MQKWLAEAEMQLTGIIKNGDINAFIAQFDLKCARNMIAKIFGYCDAKAYAREARNYLHDDNMLRKNIRQRYFAPLIKAMNEEQEKQAAAHAAAAASSAAAEAAPAAGK